MELIDRKRIANKALPKFGFGFTPPSLDDTLMQAQSFNHPSTTQGVTTAAGAFKAELMAKNAAAKDLGGMPSNFTKAAPKGGAGQFLKNNAGGIANAAMSAIDFVGTIGDISKNKISSDEMMGTGGTMQQNVNGIGYTEERVDEAGVQRQIDETAKAGTTAAMGKGAALGGAVGTIFGPVGTGIGTLAGGVIGGIAGLFGSSKAKREAERQKRIAINRTHAANAQKRETAFATGLRNEFNRTNVTDESQSLFHAALGVEDIENDVNPITRRTKHKHLVDTAEHGVVSGFGNSFGSEGEQMISGKKDKNGMHKVHGIKRGPNDTALMDLKPRDSVMSRLHVDWETGLPIADAVALNAKMHGGKISAEDKTRYEMNLKVEKMLLDSGRRRGNVLPGYIGGTNKVWNTIKNIGSSLDWGNIIPTATAFASAALRDAQAEGGLRTPKSYVANPYEHDAMQQLNSLHSDYYPVWTLNRELEARGKSAIAQSGGLSAGQRMLGYMGLANKMQQNNAAALFEHQGRENALRAQAANAALQAGNQSATRQQQAYQWDEDMLAKAHAARLNMWETSAYDRQNALTQYFKNRWEKNQFDRTMNLYESQLEIDKAATQAMIDSLKSNNTNGSKTTTTKPTLADVAKSVTTSAGRASLGAAQLPQLPQLPEIPTVAPKVKGARVEKTPTRKKTTSKKITLTKDSMGQQFANVVATPQKKESKKATTQAKPTEDVTTKSTLLSSVLAGGRNLISLSSNKDISPYSVVKQEEHKLKSKAGKSNASSFAENVSETVSKAYEDGQKKRKSQLKKQPAKQESKAGKSNASSFLDALSKLYAEGLKRREKTLKEQRGY